MNPLDILAAVLVLILVKIDYFDKGTVELYNLTDDIAEQHNLAKKLPLLNILPGRHSKNQNYQ